MSPSLPSWGINRHPNFVSLHQSDKGSEADTRHCPNLMVLPDKGLKVEDNEI
jgi:hypothetical protein